MLERRTRYKGKSGDSSPGGGQGLDGDGEEHVGPMDEEEEEGNLMLMLKLL